MNNGHDALLFVYTSDKKHEKFKLCNAAAYEYDLASLTLRQLGIKSIVVGVWDMVMEGAPTDLGDKNVPGIYFFPA